VRIFLLAFFSNKGQKERETKRRNLKKNHKIGSGKEGKKKERNEG